MVTSLVALGSYGVLALYLTHGAWSAHRPALACGNADCVQAAWFIGWVAFALSHLRDPLITTYLSPPGHPIGLMWNNASPLLGLLLAPVSLTAGAIVAYNAGITAALALSAWAASLAIGRLTRHPGPAWTGGLIFGFSPWSIGQAWSGHLFLVSLWLIPVFFLLLVRALRGEARGGLRAGLLLGLVATAQLLISQEVFADMMLLGLLTGVGIAIGTRRTLRLRLGAITRSLFAAVAIFAATAGVPIAVAIMGPGHGLHGRLQSPWLDVADLLSLVVPRRSELLAPFGLPALVRPWGGPLFGAVYPGLPLLVVVGWAWLRHRSDPWVRGSVLLFAAAVLLALGPVLRIGGTAVGVPLPWALLLHLPVYGLLMPARIAPFAFLGAGACLAVVADRLWPERTDTRLAWPAMVAAAVVLPLVPAGPVPVWLFPAPTYFTSAALRSVPVDSLVVVAPPTLVSVDEMLWQTEAGFRFHLPWGYAIQAGAGGRASSSGPVGVLETSFQLAASGHPGGIGPGRVAQIRAELLRWNACAIVIGPMAHRALAVDIIVAVVGRPPRWTGGVALWSLTPRPGQSGPHCTPSPG